MLHSSLNCSLSMYADDTALCFSHANLRTIKENMNHDLKLIYEWSVYNKLTINATKIRCTLFAQKKKLKSVNYPKIVIGGNEISFAPTYEYLGFVLDHNLNFEPHPTRIVQRVNSTATFLYNCGNL